LRKPPYLLKEKPREKEMNISATTLYTPAQRAVLPLLGGVVAPLLGLLVYRLARRSLQETERLRNRSYLFCRGITGVLLGQFFAHTYVPTGELEWQYTMLFAAVGFVFLDVCDHVARHWNTNPHYVAAPLDGGGASEDLGLQRDIMEKHKVLVVRGGNKRSFSDTVWAAQDGYKETRRRQWVLGIVLATFAVICVMDGLLLVYRDPLNEAAVAAVITCYYVNGVFLTLAVYGAMIHAEFHIEEERRSRIVWCAVVGSLWCVCLVSSAIPVLAGITVAAAQAIVNNRVMLAFYGFSCGCVLNRCVYFYAFQLEQPGARQSVLGVLVLFVAVGQSIATGFWL
jgi:hypothetical protein